MHLDSAAGPSATRTAPPTPGGTLEPAPARLHLLTFFRFLAALWILVFHLQSRLGFDLTGPWLHLAYNGVYAMSFFFVLSGTVLAYGYYSLTASSGDCVRFYVARFARIYPAYAAIHLVSLPWLGISFPAAWERWLAVNLASAFGVQAWFPPTYVGANAGTWSISCEFFFYATFPALLPLVRHLAQPARLARALLYVVLVIGALGLVDYVFAGEVAFPHYYISPIMRLPEFILGMLLGAALRQRPADRLVTVWPVLASAVALVLASMNSVYQVGMWARANIIVIPALACLIFWSAAYEQSRPGLTRGAHWRLPCYLGEISYCFFLVQLPLLLWFDAARARGDALVRWALENPTAGRTAFYLSVLLLAIVLHEAIEKPARRFILRRSLARGGLAPVAMPAPQP